MPRLYPVARSATLVFALLTVAATGPAAEIRLCPLVSGERDLLHVEFLAGGGIDVVREGEVERFDPSGATVSRLSAGPGQRIYLSRGGGYLGCATFREGAADYAPTSSFELRDPAGMPQWVIGPTEDVSYAISSRGGVVGLSLNVNIPERNALHFYGLDGSRSARVMLPHLLDGRFSDDGALFFAHSARDGLIAFSGEGVERWRLPKVRLFAATADGGAVAAVCERRLVRIEGGRIVYEADLGGLLVRRVAIAPDAARCAVVGREELRVYDQRLRTYWVYSLAGTGHVFTSADLAAEDGWVLAGVARDLGASATAESRHPDGAVLVLDRTGCLRHRAPMAFDAWNIFTPTVRLDSSGTGATVSTRRAVYCMALPPVAG
ncbi:MAG: hypothetical protein MUE60_09035 [Candidatus Eisenbacteria bacterium]|nr:hypothetical protein [Candidatus Eisenbacteria bacterium]